MASNGPEGRVPTWRPRSRARGRGGCAERLTAAAIRMVVVRLKLADSIYNRAEAEAGFGRGKELDQQSQKGGGRTNAHMRGGRARMGVATPERVTEEWCLLAKRRRWDQFGADLGLF